VVELKLFQEQVFFATVRITVPSADGAGSSVGTGFLYEIPVSDSKICILLVSNRHVYGDPSNPIQLVFHKRDPDSPTLPLLGKSHIVAQDSFDGIYTGHPDASVDLACLNVSMIGNVQPALFFKTLKDSIIADFADRTLLPGNEVYFVGYPENRFDTKHNLPVLRKGCIASIPKVDFEGRREFLIDAQVFPGSSGSPVFTMIGNNFRLVGVVARTMIRNAQIQAVPTTVAPGVNQIIGLGFVLKAGLVKGLLDTATADIREQLESNQSEPTASPQAESLD